jgi:TPR repeat protein
MDGINMKILTIIIFLFFTLATQASTLKDALGFIADKQAAEHGDPFDQLTLASRYSKGNGVLKDDKQAVYWYTKAAEGGNKLAQLSLGSHYAKGDGVLKDDKQALYWFTKAAKQGDGYAQLMLATRYIDGIGVLKYYELAYRYKLAYMWLNLAKHHGVDNSGPLLSIITPKMTQNDINQAESMSITCITSDYKECGW